MSALEPGTPVRVTFEAVMVSHNEGIWWDVSTGPDRKVTVWRDDTAVTVTPLDPERPTLDQETIARLIDPDAFDRDDRGMAWVVSFGRRSQARAKALAVLALIQAAHPEWTP